MSTLPSPEDDSKLHISAKDLGAIIQGAILAAMSKKEWKPDPLPTGPVSENYLDAALYGHEGDELPPLVGPSFKQYAEEHAHRRASTAYHVEHAIGHLLQTLGLHENSELRELTREKFLLYKNRCLAGDVPRGNRGRLAKAPTLVKRFGEVKAFMAWCVKQGLVPDNQALVLDLPMRAVNKEKTKKSGYSDEQLTVIFRALLPFKTVPAVKIPKYSAPHRIEFYWMCLCLIFTGARRSEIGQMLRSDVKEVDGVLCFDLNEDGAEKSLKNSASRRLVPIHSQLIAAGFLDWYQQQPTEEMRVFPLLCRAGMHRVSLWWAYMLKVNGIKTAALSLHSLRHTMTVKLELSRCHPSIMHRLLGHSLGNGVEQRIYLQSLSYSVATLRDAIEQVRFPVSIHGREDTASHCGEGLVNL